MSSYTFIEGPWSLYYPAINDINGRPHKTWEIAGNGVGIAIVILPLEDETSETAEQRIANGALIAAAPDLYKVAEKLVEAADCKLLSEKHRVVEMARAAIAKVGVRK